MIYDTRDQKIKDGVAYFLIDGEMVRAGNVIQFNTFEEYFDFVLENTLGVAPHIVNENVKIFSFSYEHFSVLIIRERTKVFARIYKKNIIVWSDEMIFCFNEKSRESALSLCENIEEALKYLSKEESYE
jgi:hypothetical protein